MLRGEDWLTAFSLPQITQPALSIVEGITLFFSHSFDQFRAVKSIAFFLSQRPVIGTHAQPLIDEKLEVVEINYSIAI